MKKPIEIWNSISLNVKAALISAFVLLAIPLIGNFFKSDGRYEVKNMKLPVRSIIDANTTVTYQDEIVKIDTRTGRVWKLQHGTSNIGGYTAEFSLWDELGHTYRYSDKKTGSEK